MSRDCDVINSNMGTSTSWSDDLELQLRSKTKWNTNLTGEEMLSNVALYLPRHKSNGDVAVDATPVVSLIQVLREDRDSLSLLGFDVHRKEGWKVHTTKWFIEAEKDL